MGRGAGQRRAALFLDVEELFHALLFVLITLLGAALRAVLRRR